MKQQRQTIEITRRGNDFFSGLAPGRQALPREDARDRLGRPWSSVYRTLTARSPGR